MRHVKSWLGVSLAVGAVTTGVRAQQQAPSFTWRGEVARAQRLAVQNIIGNVLVERAAGRGAEVIATKHSGRHGNPEDVRIEVDTTAQGIAFCVVYPHSHRGVSPDRHRRDHDEDNRRHSREEICESWSDWSGHHEQNDTRVDITVRVPDGVRLIARTVSGDVDAKGLRGDSEIGSVSGDVRVSDFEANALDANTVSGAVELHAIRAGDVGAETVSGDVIFEGTIRNAGSYDFNTLSGNIELDVPGNSNADISGSTFSGSFHAPFQTSTGEGKRRRHRYSAKLGNGGAKVTLSSFSGDVEIRSSK